MTPELHRRASDLFELRELPDAVRSAGLDSACAGNAELRAQVVRLLEADREAASGAFLQGHALEDAASLVDRDPFNLPSPGTIIGNYRLGTRIGAGGMGVGFEAHDP